MKTSACLAAAAALGVTLMGRAALAEEGQGGGKDYAYIFKDDALHTDLSEGATPRITVLKSAQRPRLLAPRINFVPELLKTVENM